MNVIPYSGQTATFAVLCLMLVAEPAGAQETQRWTGPADAPLTVTTSWWDERNWQNFTTPTSGDSALLGWDTSFNTDPATYIHFGDFTQIGGNPMVAGGVAQLNDLEIQSGSFVFDFSPFNTPGGSGGGLETQRMFVGLPVLATGSPGTASLRQANGLITTRELLIGSFDSLSRGSLTIGGAMTQFQSNWGVALRAGDLNVTDGGTLRSGLSTTTTVIRSNTADRSRATISNGALWDNVSTQFLIGNNGELVVESGGRLQTTNALVFGSDGPSLLRVGGAGSSVDVAFTRTFGDSTIDVLAGGTLDAGSLLDIAVNPGYQTDVIVNGIGARLDAESVNVAGQAGLEGGVGTLSAIEGDIVIQNRVTTYSQATINATGGSITIGSGDPSLTDPGELRVTAGGELRGVGMITADVLNDGGVITPGFSAGEFTIDGDLSLLSGTLSMEIGAMSDLLIVSGDVELGGLFQVSDLGDTIVQPGDKFDFLHASSITGTFDGFQDFTPYGLELLFDRGVASLRATIPNPGTLAVAPIAGLIAASRRRSRGQGGPVAR